MWLQSDKRIMVKKGIKRKNIDLCDICQLNIYVTIAWSLTLRVWQEE